MNKKYEITSKTFEEFYGKRGVPARLTASELFDMEVLREDSTEAEYSTKEDAVKAWESMRENADTYQQGSYLMGTIWTLWEISVDGDGDETEYNVIDYSAKAWLHPWAKEEE